MRHRTEFVGRFRKRLCQTKLAHIRQPKGRGRR
jgi:hypothetical protein